MSLFEAKIKSICINFEVNITSIIYFFITYCNALGLNNSQTLAHSKQTIHLDQRLVKV